MLLICYFLNFCFQYMREQFTDIMNFYAIRCLLLHNVYMVWHDIHFGLVHCVRKKLKIFCRELKTIIKLLVHNLYMLSISRESLNIFVAPRYELILNLFMFVYSFFGREMARKVFTKHMFPSIIQIIFHGFDAF